MVRTRRRVVGGTAAAGAVLLGLTLRPEPGGPAFSLWG